LKRLARDTGLNDASSAHAEDEWRTVIVCAFEYAFIGGSMGAVVGEAITQAIEQAPS
jgi:acetyl-CoA carboxylase beta subunit